MILVIPALAPLLATTQAFLAGAVVAPAPAAIAPAAAAVAPAAGGGVGAAMGAGVGISSVQSLVREVVGATETTEREAVALEGPPIAEQKLQTAGVERSSQTQLDILSELQKQTKKGVPEAGKIVTEAAGRRY